MPATEPDTPRDRRAIAGGPAQCRSATTNRPLRGRVSGRSRVGRRIKDLYHAYLARMGGPADPISQAAALNCAELSAALEAARLAAARGSGIDVDQLVRLSNLVARAEKKLGLSCGPAPAVTPLRERL